MVMTVFNNKKTTLSSLKLQQLHHHERPAARHPEARPGQAQAQAQAPVAHHADETNQEAMLQAESTLLISFKQKRPAIDSFSFSKQNTFVNRNRIFFFVKLK